MNDSAVESLFLHLLSAAIWDKEPDADRYAGLNEATWNSIIRLAKQQSSLALIADKVLALPEPSLPPRPMRISLYTFAEKVKATNLRMGEVLNTLSAEYAGEGFSFILLKGLSNGLNYPQPLLRNPGDIDLLLYRKGDYERAKQWLVAQNIDMEDGDHIHYKFDKDGVSIENHHRITYFDNKKYDRLFKEWEQRLFEAGQFDTVDIAGVAVGQLPTELNAFFIFQHMFRHFVHLGVGFRQFCDWLLFLQRHKDELSAESFTALAESYALLYPMQLFARVATDYLDAPESLFPFPMIAANKHSEMIIADLMDSGNFGFHRAGKKRPPSKYAGMWFSFVTTIRRSIKFGDISPEHIRLLPYKKFFNRMRIGFGN